MGVRLTITWRDDPRQNDAMRNKLLIAAEKYGLLPHVVSPTNGYSFRIQTIVIPAPPGDARLVAKQRFEKFVNRLRNYELPIRIHSTISDFTG